MLEDKGSSTAPAKNGASEDADDSDDDSSEVKNKEGKKKDNKESETADRDKSEDESEEGSDVADTSDINASVITMPKMSDTMTEGIIANWLKKVGDDVKSGDVIAEVETDKATMELEAYESGKLLYIAVEAGESVAIDGVIAIVGEEGADYKALLQAHKGNGKSDKKEAKAQSESKDKVKEKSEKEDKDKEKEQPKADQKQTHAHASPDGRIIASPLAKKLAEDRGYDISNIKGSGDGGRIIKRDVESYTPEAKPAGEAAKKVEVVELPQVVGEEQYEEVKLSQMRKTIARRLSESKFTAPHFYLTMEINMDKAVAARESMNEISPVKLSFNDLVIKATAAALRKHPDVNVSWQGDTLRKNKHINIGVAVAVPEGLLVPVVRFADNKTLSHIAAEVKELATKANKKQLQPADWEGSTFTISNLGMFGIEEFTAIINPPDACILAVGGIKQTPIVKDGQIVPGNVMKVTLSCDHRAVDGAVGADFLKTLKGLLEDPVRILI